jgi:hypothetical protein
MKALVALVFMLASLSPLHAKDKHSCSSEDQSGGRCFLVGGNPYASCSTEIVNHSACAVVFDRRYPVTLPTIQMAPLTPVIVLMEDPLPFETLSLDETGATALPGTEQLAQFVTVAIPQLKGFAASSVTIPAAHGFVPLVEVKDPDQDLMTEIDSEFSVMEALYNSAARALPDEVSSPKLYEHMRTVYAQLNQAMAPIPKPGSNGRTKYEPPQDAGKTPNPWNDYDNWRKCLLYELVGGDEKNVTCVTSLKPGDAGSLPDFNDVLGEIAKLQARLPSTPPAPAVTDPIFDQSTFEGIAKHIENQMKTLQRSENVQKVKSRLKQDRDAETSLLARLSVLSATLTSVQKDFVTDYQNILMAQHGLPLREKDDKGHNLPYAKVGIIDDPQAGRKRDVPVLYAKFFGRQAVFAINAVNNVGTAQTSIITTSGKVSIATVTVLYANPRLESSAGAMVSFVHNRSFSNQTITNPMGTPYQAGDVVIAQSKTAPEIVPFAALHWRPFNEYLMPDHRRGAFYGTIFVGLNAYIGVPEFGGGLTFSWRSLMFSALYNRAHQTTLVSPQTQGMRVCAAKPPANNIPPSCMPPPAAPVTHTTPLNAFAIGISVRIPTSFAAGTGGVSR